MRSRIHKGVSGSARSRDLVGGDSRAERAARNTRVGQTLPSGNATTSLERSDRMHDRDDGTEWGPRTGL
jgi:hypothetical protein